MTTVPMNNQTSYTTDNKTTKGARGTTVSVIADKTTQSNQSPTTKTSSSPAEEGRDCPGKHDNIYHGFNSYRS